MRIKLNLQIFIFLIIFYFTKQIELYVTIIFFALIHELGHILIGIIYGLKPKILKITPFGISIYFEKYKRNGKKILEKQKIFIAIAGPLINLLITLCFVIYPYDFIVSKEYIIFSNILLAIFNLLPIYPLDGGRILKSILTLNGIDKKRIIILIERISYITVLILTVLSSILILLLQNIAIFFIIIYLWILIIRQIKYNKFKLKAYEILNDKKINIKN